MNDIEILKHFQDRWFCNSVVVEKERKTFLFLLKQSMINLWIWAFVLICVHYKTALLVWSQSFVVCSCATRTCGI